MIRRIVGIASAFTAGFLTYAVAVDGANGWLVPHFVVAISAAATAGFTASEH